jgi:hypothetical protein
MSSINLDEQKKMQEALKDYLEKKPSTKSYSLSMRELSAWLEKKAK